MVDYKEVIRTLSDHAVDSIIVGGLSAILNGAPIVTLDLDILHSRVPPWYHRPESETQLRGFANRLST